MYAIREEVCFELARRLMKPSGGHTDNYDAYSTWRQAELERQWRHFSSADITGKDVIDFGCGFGNLTFHLAELAPRTITGIEITELGFKQAEKLRQAHQGPYADRVHFRWGAEDRVPLEDGSADTIIAFDCVEHIKQLETIVREWARVLRPGGKVLIWWSPYRGPWGPHMESIIPIPWAHVLFGERALFKTAARLYELATFSPAVWHFDEKGERKPNPWKQWTTFAEQGHINQINAPELRDLISRTGFEVTRFEPHGFSGSPARRLVSGSLARLPVLGEWLTSYYTIECTKR